MRRILTWAMLTTVLVTMASLGNTANAQYEDYDEYDSYDRRGEVTYQTFYDELSPYGRWIDYPEYGYVWVPDAGRGFRPYGTNGRWVWTIDFGWMWVSGYSWGWAPFHYGRWLYDPFYGWIWVPGYEWSPAWVAWRSGGDFYGWAPLMPGIHISINFSIGRYSPPYNYWCFTPRRYISSPYIYRHFYEPTRNVTIINQTTIINNYNYTQNVFSTGPTRYEAERYAGSITPVRFRESSKPGRPQFRNNEVSVFKPSVRQENRQDAPRKFERYSSRPGNQNDGVRQNSESNTRRPEVFDRRQKRTDNPSTGNGNNLPQRERPAISNKGRRDENIERRPQQMERRPQQMERRPEQMERRPQQMERRPDQMERRPQQMERRPDQMERRPDKMERRPQQMERQQPPQREIRTMPQERPSQMERRQSRPEPQQRAQSPQPRTERTYPAPQQPQYEQRSQENRQGNGGGNGNGSGRGNGKNKG